MASAAVVLLGKICFFSFLDKQFFDGLPSRHFLSQQKLRIKLKMLGELKGSKSE
jgi:hypothetical protein